MPRQEHAQVSRNVSSQRRSIKDRQCDDCQEPILAGGNYMAYIPYRGERIVPGPHMGWWYWCLACAWKRGAMAPAWQPDVPHRLRRHRKIG